MKHSYHIVVWAFLLVLANSSPASGQELTASEEAVIKAEVQRHVERYYDFYYERNPEALSTEIFSLPWMSIGGTGASVRTTEEENLAYFESAIAGLLERELQVRLGARRAPAAHEVGQGHVGAGVQIQVGAGHNPPAVDHQQLAVLRADVGVAGTGHGAALGQAHIVANKAERPEIDVARGEALFGENRHGRKRGQLAGQFGVGKRGRCDRHRSAAGNLIKVLFRDSRTDGEPAVVDEYLGL